MFIRLLVSFSFLMFFGCSSTAIKSINDFSPVPMNKSEMMPSGTELEGRPYRVVVFGIDDDQVALAKKSEIGDVVTQNLMRLISKSNAKAINGVGMDDLRLAIVGHSAAYNKDATDYAVTGQIAVANFKSKYNKVKTYKEKRLDSNTRKKSYAQKPTCSYTALVQGNLNVYDVKSMSRVKDIAISGGSFRTIDATRNYYQRCPRLSNSEVLNMMRSAAAKAVSRENVLLKNLFQPNGYVLERRSNGKTSIFKVSFGQKNGIEEGQKAVFFASDRSRHAITGKMNNDKYKIAEGDVTNQIGTNNAWVMMDDEAIAAQIKVGDIVKVSYEKSFFGKLFNRSYN